MANKTSTLQRWLENIWYNNGKGKALLLPLAGLYCLVNQIQRYWQTQKKINLPCPVVVVGNISIGGTGKTPLTIYLSKLLQEAGYKPAIITRGYGGRAIHWPQAVTAISDTQEVGDEAVLMAIRTGIPVYAGPNRLASIKLCLDQHDCDVILSDDGLQHYKMPRDIQIAVIDGKRRFGNGLCLPAGPLREPLKYLNSCDFIIVNGANTKLPKEDQQEKGHEKWHKMHVDGNDLMNIQTEKIQHLTNLKDQKVNAVTGIGNPQRFYNTLEKAGLKLNKHSFPDHYQFQPEDLLFDNDLPVIMTEKDAVKCQTFAHKKCWYLPVKAKLGKPFDQQFMSLLTVSTDNANSLRELTTKMQKKGGVG